MLRPLLFYGSVPRKAEDCLGDPWERVLIHPDRVHNKCGLKPLALEFNFLISKPKSVWNSLSVSCPTTGLLWGSKIGGAFQRPQMQVCWLYHKGQLCRAPPPPSISYHILWALQSKATRERGEGMRQYKQQTWVPVSEQGGRGREEGDGQEVDRKARGWAAPL